MAGKRQALLLAAALASVTLSGCAAALIAGGAAAGYAFTRDAMVVHVERARPHVWRAALQQTQRMGTLKRQDEAAGRIEARIEGADVVVTLAQVSPSSVRVEVRARKNLMPKRDLAERLGLAIQREAGGNRTPPPFR